MTAIVTRPALHPRDWRPSQFIFQGQLFLVTGGWVHVQAGALPLVQITCKQLVPGSPGQLSLSPLMLEAHDD